MLKWFACTFHRNIFNLKTFDSGDIAECKDGDNNKYANHCVCAGPFATSQEAMKVLMNDNIDRSFFGQEGD